MSVIIGMDPHKRSATIEVIDQAARILAGGRYGTDKTGYAELLAAGRKFPERVWAVQGCNGIGKHLAHRLVHDGEVVFDVPTKLSAQVRVFATGDGRKTDPVDAHSVALGGAAGTAPGPGTSRGRPGGDGHAGGSARRAGTGPHPDHQPAAPAAAGPFPSRGCEVPVLAQGPGDDRHHPAPRPGRQDQAPAGGGADRRARGDRQEDQGDQDRAARADRGPRIHVDGTHRHRPLGGRPAPGRRRRHPPLRRPRQVRLLEPHRTLGRLLRRPARHRLSRAGNRRINPTLHITAIAQLRNPTQGRAYFDAKKAARKTSKEAMRALKRRLSNLVYTRMLADQNRREATGPGGALGDDSAIQRDRPDPGHRLFGKATSRTRLPQA